MRVFFVLAIVFFSNYSYPDKRILIGESNFTHSEVHNAVEMLKSEIPGVARRCWNIDKIYSKVLKEKIDKSGKKYSEEKWMLSGCHGTNAVIAILYPNGLMQIKNVRH